MQQGKIAAGADTRTGHSLPFIIIQYLIKTIMIYTQKSITSLLTMYHALSFQTCTTSATQEVHIYHGSDTGIFCALILHQIPSPEARQ